MQASDGKPEGEEKGKARVWARDEGYTMSALETGRCSWGIATGSCSMNRANSSWLVPGKTVKGNIRVSVRFRFRVGLNRRNFDRRTLFGRFLDGQRAS